MKTTVKQHLFAAPVLLALVIALNSFVPAQRNSIANGGGIAGDIHFNFNAVTTKDGVVGHLQYGADSYTVECAEWISPTSAILYTSGGVAFLVTDNGEGGNGNPDTISEPVVAECGDDLDAGDFLAYDEVTSGNIQVKQ